MKIFGWVLVVFAILNFFAFIVGAAQDISSDMVGRHLGISFSFGVLGAYLIHRGNQKEKEKEEDKNDDWGNE
jgi:hypothetical protein